MSSERTRVDSKFIYGLIAITPHSPDYFENENNAINRTCLDERLSRKVKGIKAFVPTQFNIHRFSE